MCERLQLLDRYRDRSGYCVSCTGVQCQGLRGIHVVYAVAAKHRLMQGIAAGCAAPALLKSSDCNCV